MSRKEVKDLEDLLHKPTDIYLVTYTYADDIQAEYEVEASSADEAQRVLVPIVQANPPFGGADLGELVDISVTGPMWTPRLQ